MTWVELLIELLSELGVLFSSTEGSITSDSPLLFVDSIVTLSCCGDCSTVFSAVLCASIIWFDSEISWEVKFVATSLIELEFSSISWETKLL